jgi:hypothetical protein
MSVLLLVLIANLVSQAGAILPAPDSGLLPQERSQLQKEQAAEKRAKIYLKAFERLHQVYDAKVAQKDFAGVPPVLDRCMNLLAASSQDINSSAGWKKKSKVLINYEIQLRESINEVDDYRIKAPVEQLDYLESWTAQAEQIRRKFMDLIFDGK